MPVLKLFLLLTVIQWVYPDNIDLKTIPSDAGMFIKRYISASQKQHHRHKDSQLKTESTFVILRPTDPLFITASAGSVSQSQRVSLPLLQPHYTDKLANRVLLQPGALSAHLVGGTTTKNQRIQVLFHTSSEASFRPPRSDPVSEYCAYLYVQNNQEQVTASCRVKVNSRGSSVCLVEPLIPLTWWSDDQAVTVSLYYTAKAVSRRSTCGTPRLHIPATTSPTPKEALNFLCSLSLIPRNEAMIENKDESAQTGYIVQHEQRNVRVGRQFLVTLQPVNASMCSQLKIGIKVKRGLVLLDSRLNQPGNIWRSDDGKVARNHRHKDITLKATGKASENEASLPILTFFLYVEQDDETSKRAVNFAISCQGSNKIEENIIQVKLKLEEATETTRQLVPIVKHTELLNTAVVNGREVKEPLDVYEITDSGQVRSVRSQSTCHGNEKIIQVSSDCEWLKLSGRESLGSSNISIIVKHGRLTSYLSLRIWYPEMAADLAVDDERLNSIQGWNVPEYGEDQDYHFLDTKSDTDVCINKLQDTKYNVYMNFYVPDSHGSRSYRYLAPDDLFKMTHSLQGQVKVKSNGNDENMRIVGNSIHANSRGKSDITVFSPTHRKIGGVEVRVPGDTEPVKLVSVQSVVVSDLQLQILPSPIHITGRKSVEIKATTTNRLDQLQQTAELHTSLYFNDGSTISLRDVPQSTYALRLTSYNNSLIAPLHRLSNDSLPQVTALGSGQGRLLKLSLMNTCGKRDAIIEADIFVKITSGAGRHSGTFHAKDWSSSIIVDSNGIRQVGEGGETMTTETVDRDKGYSGLEIGMYVLLAVFCCAVVVFGLNCLVFYIRYRRRKTSKQKPVLSAAAPLMQPANRLASNTPPEPEVFTPSCAGTSARDWVWVGSHQLRSRPGDNSQAYESLPHVHDTPQNGPFHEPAGYLPYEHSRTGSVQEPPKQHLMSGPRHSPYCSTRVSHPQSCGSAHDSAMSSECPEPRCYVPRSHPSVSSSGYNTPRQSRPYSPGRVNQPCYSNIEPAPTLPITRPPPCPSLPTPPQVPPPRRSPPRRGSSLARISDASSQTPETDYSPRSTSPAYSSCAATPISGHRAFSLPPVPYSQVVFQPLKTMSPALTNSNIYSGQASLDQNRGQVQYSGQRTDDPISTCSSSWSPSHLASSANEHGYPHVIGYLDGLPESAA